MKKYAESAPIAINFTVDVDQGITIKPKLLTIQQGEHNARYFQVSLVHNDMPINLVNSEVHFLTQPHKSDEIPTTTNCEIYDAENGQIMVAVKDYMSNKKGIINGEFVRVGKDGSSLPFKHFTISVDGSIFVNDGLGQSEPLHSLVSALSRVQRVEEYLEQEFMDVEAKYAGELSKTNAQLLQQNQRIEEFISHETGGNMQQEHSHVNKNILDKFNLHNEELYFNGKKIGSEIENDSITGEKIANGAVGAKKTSFLQIISQNYFKGEEVLIGEKIVTPANSKYSITTDELYMISGFIPLKDATTPIKVYSYGRMAFFGEAKNYIDGLGAYESSINGVSNATINLSEYPSLSHARYIKVCIKKEYMDAMYIKQGETSLSGDDEVYFEGLRLTQEQVEEVFKNISKKTISISVLKEVETNNGVTITYEDGYKIAANGDDGYIPGRFNLVVKDEASTTNLIPITASNDGVWEFEKIARISFFDENENYMDSLYDALSSTDGMQPPTSINLFERFPTLVNAKYVRVTIRTEDKEKWVLKINNIQQNIKQEVSIAGLKLSSEQVVEGITDKSLPISVLKEVEVENNKSFITYDDGYKIWANGDDGYIPGRFNLVVKDEASTTNLIPITASNDGVWKFKKIARISFFDENENYMDSLYDALSSTDGMQPPTSINLFERFPTLVNAKYVRVTIRTEDKEDWSLKIEGVEYSSKKNLTINDLVINNNNLSNEIKTRFSKIEDNSFKYHKDTTVVFRKNKDFASTHFRIPFMCVTNLGTIITGCDIRYNSWNDHSLIDLGTARSEDGGKTWIDKTVAIPNPGVSSTLSRVMDGTILATKEGRVFLIGNKFNTGSTGWTQVNTPNDPNWDCVLYHSDDDGRTWQFNQSLKSLLPQGQISFLGGVGSGIQMKNGTLVFPIQMSRANDRPFKCQSGIIYSTDKGNTWTMSTTLVPEFTSECSVVEYPTNTIMINCRQEGQNHRSIFKTTNLGTTWEATPMNTGTQQTNACQGHMCKIKVGFDKEVVLFTNPINDGSNREDGAKLGYDRSNLSLSVLLKDEVFKPIHTLYRPHSDGYSCMAFDERRNRLYVVMELGYNLVFKDITDVLPTVQMYKMVENSLETID